MGEQATRPLYCGLCPGYGDHDTGHHGKGEIAAGDRVTVVVDGRVQECQVIEVRGHEAQVRVIKQKDVRKVKVKDLQRP